MPDADERGETAELEFQGISAGGDRREAVHAGAPETAVGVPITAGPDSVTVTPGSTAALIVGDLADELAERLASLCRRRRETERRHNRQGRKYSNERTFHR